MSKPRAVLSPMERIQRENRLQQREDRLTYKVSDLRAQIASLTAENKRLKHVLLDINLLCLVGVGASVDSDPVIHKDKLNKILQESARIAYVALQNQPEQTA